MGPDGDRLILVDSAKTLSAPFLITVNALEVLCLTTAVFPTNQRSERVGDAKITVRSSFEISSPYLE